MVIFGGWLGKAGNVLVSPGVLVFCVPSKGDVSPRIKPRYMETSRRDTEVNDLSFAGISVQVPDGGMTLPPDDWHAQPSSTLQLSSLSK